MRFESKDFIKSQRQWQESRESKTKSDRKFLKENKVRKSIPNARGFVRSTGTNVSRIGQAYERNKCLRQKHSSFRESNNIGHDHDDRDPNDSQIVERSGEGSTDPKMNDSGPPSDFSRKELEQLSRSKQSRIADKPALAGGKRSKICSSAQETEGIHNKSAETLLSARNTVRKAQKENGKESSIGIDTLLLHILPSHVWFGDFFMESHDALNNIQRRMLIEYSRNNY